MSEHTTYYPDNLGRAVTETPVDAYRLAERVAELEERVDALEAT